MVAFQKSRKMLKIKHFFLKMVAQKMRTSDSMWEIWHLISLMVFDFLPLSIFNFIYSILICFTCYRLQNHNPFVLIYCSHITTWHVLYLAIVIDLSVSPSTRIFYSRGQEQCLFCSPPYLRSLKWCTKQVFSTHWRNDQANERLPT